MTLKRNRDQFAKILDMNGIHVLHIFELNRSANLRQYNVEPIMNDCSSSKVVNIEVSAFFQQDNPVT